MADAEKYQQQANELSQQLWNIANDLRGNMDASKFKNYILGMIFYRYLSERTELYMSDLLADDGIAYADAYADAQFRPVVEQWSMEHLGYIIKPANLFHSLVDKITKPKSDEDKFSIENLERAI